MADHYSMATHSFTSGNHGNSGCGMSGMLHNIMMSVGGKTYGSKVEVCIF